MASRSDSSRLLAVGMLKFPSVLIPSIQSVGIGRCDPPRVVMYPADILPLLDVRHAWNVSFLVVEDMWNTCCCNK
ncbi:hypothetical protein TNCV_3062711 [Trichonephila clavipes]|nr:hypothetical protein TNCV_3062711 [Trichonephila clavipes]